jgi:hypothetical protein
MQCQEDGRQMVGSHHFFTRQNFIHLNVSTTLELYVVEGHEELERVDAWNRRSRLVFAGTSPPQTTFESPNWQPRLEVEVRPVIDFR